MIQAYRALREREWYPKVKCDLVLRDHVNANILSDLGREVESCYLSYKGKVYYFCGRAIAVEGQPYLLALDLGGIPKLWINSESPDLKYMFPPKIGYVNIHNKAFYLFRKIGRNWRYGVTNSNTSAFSPVLSEVNGTPSVSMREVFGAYNLFEPREFPSKQEALKRLRDNECISVAISEDIAVAINTDLATLLIYYTNIPIARTNMSMSDYEMLVPWYEDTVKEVINQ